MAGHSKWANIKHKKSKEDQKRGKIFSKITKMITVAAREGGGDPEMNSDLRLAIQKAKDNNMPSDNVERAIKRGTGDLEGVSYEKIVYEGYGPGGVALYIELMTDNRNRTAAEIRHLLSKGGGNLGENGCVAWMFNRKGQLLLELEETGIDEDELLLEAIELGAEDVLVEDNIATIYTKPGDFEELRKNLEAKGISFSSADIAMIPENTIDLKEKEAKKMLKLMEALEDHDDVQEVYANFDIDDQLMAQINNE